MRPGTMPEIGGERQPWHEISDAERRDVMLRYRKKWKWQTSVEDLDDLASATTMPWEVPRLIGHRGTGKDKGTL